MNRTSRIMCCIGVVLLVSGIGFTGNGILPIKLVTEAVAIIGAPRTPVSYAGVARRATRRMVYAETAAATSTAAAASQSAAAAAQSAEASAEASAAAAQAAASGAASGVPVGTVVQALPAGCTAVTVGGNQYQDCGGTFYKAAFQGNNLVYVAVEKPMQ